MHGIRCQQRVAVGVCTGKREHRHREDPLAADSQALAAGGEHLQPGCNRQRLFDEGRGAGHEVLAVVEDEDELLVTEMVQQALTHRRALALLDSEHGRDAVVEELLVPDARQLHQPRAISIVGDGVDCELHRKPRLAHPADSGQRHQRELLERCGDFGELPCAADEPVARHRQIPEQSADRSHRGELVGESRRGYLVHAFRA